MPRCPTPEPARNITAPNSQSRLTSPAAMAYTTTETGIVTMLIVLVTAVYLLTRRAADFRIA
jgi:hypothetical protein